MLGGVGFSLSLRIGFSQSITVGEVRLVKYLILKVNWVNLIFLLGFQYGGVGEWATYLTIFSYDRRSLAQGLLVCVMFCSVIYETSNLSFWGPNWLNPLILAIPSGLSAPLKPSGAPLETSISIYLCQINQNLYET